MVFALYAAGLVLVVAAMRSAVAGDSTAAELSSSVPGQATGGTWTATGDLGTPRDRHTTTLLPNDQVLVTGGSRDNNTLASAQLYHPAIGRWQRIANMNHKRGNHTATLLSNGQVLVAGGVGCDDECSPGRRGPAELYDPTNRTWTDTGSLASARWYHTATLLPNRKVLVAGGQIGDRDVPGRTVETAELYDPATGVWTAADSMNHGRAFHTATLLPNGQVLVADGLISFQTLATAELYDPATGVWTLTGFPATARYAHTATLLADGRVLVAGGFSDTFFNASASAELYDPATGVWTATGSMTTARGFHTATLLADGQVLVAGGYNNTTREIASAELYDPATGMWTATDNMATGRYYQTATLLPNGQVLVAGGVGDGFITVAGAELYQSAP